MHSNIPYNPRIFPAEIISNKTVNVTDNTSSSKMTLVFGPIPFNYEVNRSIEYKIGLRGIPSY